MEWHKARKNIPIFPLSCNPKLSKEELTGIDIFFDHLKHAFKNPRIRNIAITGPFGVGKSSIIRSFNDQHISPIKKRKRFLYINLGDYANAESPNTGTKPVPGPATPQSVGCSSTTATSNCPCKYSNKKTEPNEKNAIERRLLMQIYAAFDPQKFPYSCFRQVPKAPGILKTSLFMLFAMALLLLLLKAPLANLLLGWTPQWPSIQICRNYIIEYHPFLEVVLYGIVLLGAAVLIFRGFRLIIPKMKASRLALNLTNAEMDLEKDACEDYLDEYTQELIYCLKRVHNQIDGTVVFEDMDRLSTDMCVGIFTRLREINHILNAHLDGRKYARFVFVVNDKLACELLSDKFFDYILPVIPSLTKVSAEFILRKNLTEINTHLETACREDDRRQAAGPVMSLFVKHLDKHPKSKQFLYWVQNKLCTDKKCPGYARAIRKWIEQCGSLSQKYVSYSCFQDMARDGKEGILFMAAPYLTNYRKQYAILNEYALVVRLYHRNNPGKLTCNVLEGILAFIIYKHLWPEDYERCITGRKNVLTGRAVQEAASDSTRELLGNLLEFNMLTIRCFHYAGFSEDDVNKLWEAKLYAGTVKTQCRQIREIRKDDTAYVEILKNFCQANPEQSNPCADEVLAEAINCLLRYRFAQTDWVNDWFFKNRDITDCLRVLASIDHASCIAFIRLCKGTDQTCDIFAKCLRRKVIHTLNGEWDLAMARIFVTGVCRDQLEADELYLINKTVVNLQTLDGLFDASPAGVGD